MEQFGSGHSISIGEGAVDTAAGGSIDGLEDPAPLELERLRLLALPLDASSAFLTPLPLALLLLPLRLPPDVNTSLAGLGGAAIPAAVLPPPTPRRPLAPLRNLLCIGLREASANPAIPIPPAPLVGTGVLVAPRPLFARPLGARDSASLVGESQNLGGAQSFFVQSISVPTYVLPRHVTFTTKTPPSVSCQTMPSKVTAVPGSQGPRHSGSVIVEALAVPTQASALETTSDDEQDVEWDEHGEPSALGLEEVTDIIGLWPLTSNPALGGVTANRVTLRFVAVTVLPADRAAGGRLGSVTLSDARWLEARHFLAGGLGGSVHVDVIRPTDVLFAPLTMRASGRPGPARLLSKTAAAEAPTGVTVTGDPMLLPYVGLDPLVGGPAVPLVIPNGGRTTVESGGVRLLGNTPPGPTTTTGVTVKLLVADEGTTMAARKEAGDPPPETVTGVTVTPDDVVIIPATVAVAVTVTAAVVVDVLPTDALPGGILTAGGAATFSLDLSLL